MTPRKKLIIAGSIFGGLCLILIILAIIFRFTEPSNNNVSNNPEQNRYVDPVSGETVLDPEGKVPEGEETLNGTTLLGFSKLLDIGISGYQVDLAKYAFFDYSEQNTNPKITQISLKPDSLTQSIDPNDGAIIVNGTVVVNRETERNVKFFYYAVNLTSLYTEIYGDNGAVIYQSQYDAE